MTDHAKRFNSGRNNQQEPLNLLLTSLREEQRSLSDLVEARREEEISLVGAIDEILSQMEEVHSAKRVDNQNAAKRKKDDAVAYADCLDLLKCCEEVLRPYRDILPKTTDGRAVAQFLAEIGGPREGAGGGARREAEESPRAEYFEEEGRGVPHWGAGDVVQARFSGGRGVVQARHEGAGAPLERRRPEVIRGKVERRRRDAGQGGKTRLQGGSRSPQLGESGGGFFEGDFSGGHSAPSRPMRDVWNVRR